MVPIIAEAKKYVDRRAIIDADSVYSYRELIDAATRVASALLNGRSDLSEARIAFMVPPGLAYVATQWGIWLAGGIAVPLCLTHPLPEIEYVLADTHAEALVAHPDCREKLAVLADSTERRFLLTTAAMAAAEVALPEVDATRRAMILYTSGTTSRPKGVVTTHANIASQITSLTIAWQWTKKDHILHVLPLHHTHGIINALSCALWSGAVCEMLPRFDAEAVWECFVSSQLTLFMAVPTIYVRLIDYWEKAAADQQANMSLACHKLRLMVSGSAALPVSVLEKWQRVSGHTLLERYGMTEIGMALSNPYEGERRPGFVGQPLPGVELRLVDETGKTIANEGEQGEIIVRGPNVFLDYWQQPDATRQAFRKDWFLTGDIAARHDGYYRIIGRSSVDIIKTGGYKVSALEIEEILRTHSNIRECAVVGMPDAEWGEVVAVAAALKPGASLTLRELRDWAKTQMAAYKCPSRLRIMNNLPRNVMGKVLKPAVKKLFAEETDKD